MPARDPRTPAESVLARLGVLPPDECWVWPGARTTHGYGAMSTLNKRQTVHRVMYEHVHGPVPAGLHVLHTCDNPPCCNPAHLYAGTQADNMRDMAERGRAPSVNRAKTHCAHGHPLTGDNLYLPPGRNERVCRECKRQQWRAWYRRTR